MKIGIPFSKTIKQVVSINYLRSLSFISFLAVVTTCLPFLAFAQQTPEEYIQQQEQLKRIQLRQEIDSGAYYIEIGKYELADAKLKYVLSNIKAVPSDVVFYFGKNSFFLGLYRQSVDWLNKYIQLKGTTGQYSKEAVEWLKKAEAELLVQQTKEAAKAEEILSSNNYEIDCGPTGKVICPVCGGDHVIVKRGPLQNDYRTCPYCDDHGILTCEEYNLLVQGKLKPKF